MSSATWVVLPTYNEAQNLPLMVEALMALDLGLNVVVVDDGSPDGTGDIADEMSRRFSRVHVVHRLTDRGLGTAYLAGFRHAQESGADAVMTMDCDFSHDPKVIPKMIAALDGACMVVGSRYTRGGEIKNWPFYRKLLSASANGFVRTLFLIQTRDCTSGFRLYRRDVLDGVPWAKIRSSGYAFLVESLFWVTRQKNMVIKEVPICFADRVQGVSKMGPKEILHGMSNLLRLRAHLWFTRSKDVP